MAIAAPMNVFVAVLRTRASTVDHSYLRIVASVCDRDVAATADATMQALALAHSSKQGLASSQLIAS